MTSTLLFIELLGAAALLLWGLRLLRAGVNTALGSRLRQVLAMGTRNRAAAFGAGLVATLGLQSSTAMAIIVSSFVAQSLLSPAMAQAMMLGANLGTALVTQLLSLDIRWLSPVAILIGVVASSRKTRIGHGVSDIAMGLGLMLLSLQLMSEATLPMRQDAAVTAFFGLLGEAPLIAILLAAGLAAASASSLAVVLFIASLAGATGVTAQLCLLLVAGANLGGAVTPVLAATEGVAARRVAVSNLVVRAIGALFVLVTYDRLAALLNGRWDLAQLTILSHIGFNIVLALVFLPLIGPLSSLIDKLMPDRARDTEFGPRHLDESLLTDPASALAAATRETLRIGDLVQNMLEVSLEALKTNDEALCRSVFQIDDRIDRLQEAVKLYVARIGDLDTESREKRNSIMVVDYAANLEHVGDIIERSLSPLTLKKIGQGLQYSEEGLGEIEALFQDTIDNLTLAQRVFLTQDTEMARRLMETKPAFRHKERASAESHLRRLQDRLPETVQTTSMHMDVIRDLRRINGHLVSVATPILEAAGLLRESRLRKS